MVIAWVLLVPLISSKNEDDKAGRGVADGPTLTIGCAKLTQLGKLSVVP